MSPRVQRLDLGVVCHLVADHLRTDGEDASAHGREIRVEPGLKLKLVPEPDQLDGQLASMFWIEVEGLNLEPQMRLDVSWGSTDQAIDAAPASKPPAPSETRSGRGRTRRGALVDRRGRSWVIVALGGDTDEPDEAASALRTDPTSAWCASTRSPRSSTGSRRSGPAGSAALPTSTKGGSISTTRSVSTVVLAAALPWRDVDGIQMVPTWSSDRTARHPAWPNVDRAFPSEIASDRPEVCAGRTAFRRRRSECPRTRGPRPRRRRSPPRIPSPYGRRSYAARSGT